MKDKTQKIVSYVSAYGITVYETIQYNKQADAWYMVGDSSETQEHIKIQADIHNKMIGKGNL